jgi:hypothetical protein
VSERESARARERERDRERGLGAANLGRKVRANACESVERMKARVRTNRNWEG